MAAAFRGGDVGGLPGEYFMIKRTPKFIRNARGGVVLEDGDARIIKKFTPYGLD